MNCIVLKEELILKRSHKCKILHQGLKLNTKIQQTRKEFAKQFDWGNHPSS